MRPLLLGFTLVLMPALTGTSFANVPSAITSTWPSCIQVVPGGNISTVIVVRDISNNPVPGSNVVLSYSDCPSLVVCPGPGDAYVHDPVNRTLAMTADATGKVVFNLRAGDGCATADLRIFADLVPLGSARVVSPDQNGDLVVNGTDSALEQGKVGTSDLSGDLDCDGDADSADVDFMHPYLGSTCTNPTPVRPQSWGGLKLHYR